MCLGLKEQMNRNTSQWACPAGSCGIRHGALPSRRSDGEPTLTLSRGETLILVLLLSLGLWGLIWGAVSLLAMCGLR